MGNDAQKEEMKNAAEVPSPTQRNFVLKVMDSSGAVIKKALKEKGIDVVSLIEIHKEVVNSR